MGLMTCTWAPTPMGAPHLIKSGEGDTLADAYQPPREGEALLRHLTGPVTQAESLGIDHLLVAQRWWGNAEEIEGPTYDCLAMTAYYAAITSRIKLITAIHPGFFLPAPVAKWGATLDRITGGRWAINVTSGWNLVEFGMYGADLVDHDARYHRSAEFIDILRGAWENERFDYQGKYYSVDGLALAPRPAGAIDIFQGGQSDAAIAMAAAKSDWMFLNGGPPEKVARLIEKVRSRTKETGRQMRFALYGIPLCRKTDAEAEAEINWMVEHVDAERLSRRRKRVAGAQGMWAEEGDPLAELDSNEGFATRLIGSPETIVRRLEEFAALGVEMIHLTLQDELFNAEVLPAMKSIG